MAWKLLAFVRACFVFLLTSAPLLPRLSPRQWSVRCVLGRVLRPCLRRRFVRQLRVCPVCSFSLILILRICCWLRILCSKILFILPRFSKIRKLSAIRIREWRFFGHKFCLLNCNRHTSVVCYEIIFMKRARYLFLSCLIQIEP